MATSYVIVEIFALIFWSFQLAPQMIDNWKAKSAEGLSSTMMLMWSLGSLCSAVYSIGAQFGVLFILQPNLFLCFSIVCFGQCEYYRIDGGEMDGFAEPDIIRAIDACNTACEDSEPALAIESTGDMVQHTTLEIDSPSPTISTTVPSLSLLFSHRMKGIANAVGLTLFCAIIETVGGYYLLAHCQDHFADQGKGSCSDSFWVFHVLGIVSTICFGVGFVPQFYTIYENKSVLGISRLFLLIDMSGSILSTVALLIQQKSIQPVSFTCYVIVFVCDFLILMLSFVLIHK